MPQYMPQYGACWPATPIVRMYIKRVSASHKSAKKSKSERSQF